MSSRKSSAMGICTLGQALIRWISTFSTTTPVTSLLQLQDGIILWQVLHSIGPDYFTTELPHIHARDVEQRWQNLKFVKTSVTNYLTEQCDQPADMFDKLNPNLRAIAIGVEDDDIIEVAIDKLLDVVTANTSTQLLKLVLLAAVFSPESNEELVATMRKLGPSVAAPIQRCIEELTACGDTISSKVQIGERGTKTEDQLTDSPLRAQDQKLILEEQLIQARNAAQDLQQHNVFLTKELEHARDQLAHLQHKTTTDDADSHQETDLASVKETLREEYADNISLLEQELYNAQSKITTQSKQLSKLAILEASHDKLQSDLDQLRDERDELEQRSNAGENLKKKVKALQDAQTHNDMLRQDYDFAQQELDQLRPLREQHTQLQRRLQELTQHFQSLEVSNNDDHRALERAENELSFLNQSLIESREQHQRDQEQLGEYQGRLREFESTQEDLSFASLDQELSTLESPVQSPASSLRLPTTPSTQRGGDDMSASVNSEIRTLRSRLAQAEASLAATDRPSYSPESRRGNEALQNELYKMTDAWCDITRRLQSDAVVMQRRSEAPRSWLGKMRRVVGTTGRMVS